MKNNELTTEEEDKLTLKESFNNKTVLKKEILAGTTGFFAIMYVIFVNPQIVAATGIPTQLETFATIFASAFGCILGGLLSNTPMIIVPGMGINALFSYTIAQSMHFTWQATLAVSLISSILYAILTFTPLIDQISDAINDSMKSAINVGIGLFLTFTALKGIGFIVGDKASLVKFGDLTNPVLLLTLLGIVLTMIFQIRGKAWGMIASMAIVTVIALFTGNATNTHVIQYSDLGNYGSIIFKQSFNFPSWTKFLIVTFSMLMLMVFEGVGVTKGYVKNTAKQKKTLQATGIANIFASLVGSSPAVDAAESGSSWAAGGTTGISAITTGVWFLLSLVLIPIIGYIPSCATASIIILTGSLMMMDVKEIDNKDFSNWFPAYLIIFTIPFTGSISTGMAMGVMAYPIAKLIAGKKNDLNVVNIVIAILFALSLVVTAFTA